MALAQSQFLRIFGSNGVSYHRWQSYYADGTATWEGAIWDYVQFTADGITSGSADSDASVSVTGPATPTIVDAFQAALANGRLVEIRAYQFDPTLGNNSPQGGQTLVAGYVGQAISMSATVTRMVLQLGSALAPVGAQIPPRSLTTLMMGQGCRL